jgi:hypothetical protein
VQLSGTRVDAGIRNNDRPFRRRHPGSSKGEAKAIHVRYNTTRRIDLLERGWTEAVSGRPVEVDSTQDVDREVVFVEGDPGFGTNKEVVVTQINDLIGKGDKVLIRRRDCLDQTPSAIRAVIGIFSATPKNVQRIEGG